MTDKLTQHDSAHIGDAIEALEREGFHVEVVKNAFADGDSLEIDLRMTCTRQGEGERSEYFAEVARTGDIDD